MKEQVDNKGSGDRKAAVASAPQPDWERIDRNRQYIWEALNKALNTLILGHAAGLVTCLTLLKDYKDQGLGWFIVMFGYGLILATISAVLWVIYRGS